ncbi:MAG TPA: prolyl oligopeptidase family serine peptidase [Phycisphaerales bacterium]|nr:prolyl oligopeptidase family serine peptidase [Phycisphaerales bacterium]
MRQWPLFAFSAVAAALVSAGCSTKPAPAPAPDAPRAQSPAQSTPAVQAVAAPVPTTRTAPVADTYHGVKVTDPYRWLENWDDPAVKAWSDAQNTYTRSVLDALPNVEAIRARATQLLSAEVPSYGSFECRGPYLFALKRQPPNQQPFLVMMSWPDASLIPERVLLDVNTSDPTHSTTVDWFVPSHDGRYVAVSLSTGGSEMGDVHVLDVRSGARVGQIVPRVQGGTAGGSLAWAADGSGFYYTRYPREGERPEGDLNFYVQVYYHELNADPATDRYEVGKEFPRIAEIMLETGTGGRGAEWVLASVQNGDGGEFMHFLKTPPNEASTGGWVQMTRYEDRVVQAAIGNDGSVYWVSRKDALRGKLLRTPLVETRLSVVEQVVPEGQDTIVNDFFDPSVLRITPNAIYLTYQTGGPSELRVFAKDGKPMQGPDLLPVSTVSGTTHLQGDSVLFANASYLQPTTWKVFTPGQAVHDGKLANPAKTEETRFSTKYDFVNTSGYEVRREFATSKDGTKVPVNILCKKGLALSANHPTLLTGYGGYGVNITPGFSLRDILLLEQGFVLAEANLRGGGEYGESWHLSGNLTKKQNVFDDFLACAEHLITRKYTTKDRLAIEGGSNGGLLMGAAMTQRPDLFKCVVSHVGIYDMLRVELSANGAFNIPEFGTVTNPDHFKALYAYSPYHNVKPGTQYPPVLFLTGANDPRVDPMQSRKMTALIQSTNNPALLRTSANTGHGAGTPLNARIEQTVDVAAWLCQQLGVQYK